MEMDRKRREREWRRRAATVEAMGVQRARVLVLLVLPRFALCAGS